MIGPRRIRLVVLLEDLEFGGTQRYATELLQHLDRTWFAPEVWLLRAGGDLTPAIRSAGTEVIHLSDRARVGPLAIIRLAVRLWRDQPDLLYTLTVIPNIWGRMMGGLMRIPVVSGYRSLMPRQHERLLHRFSARIIANAVVLKDIMASRLSIEPDRITVIPNGVDLERFSPDETVRSTEPLVVCVARLVKEKDFRTLLEAFRLARLEMPTARLDIVGNGPMAIPAAPNVRLLPATVNVAAHLRRAWIFALASQSEASPNAILEAMACGLPVVATAVGGIPELVDHNRTGLLVPPGDPVAMSAALMSLMRNPEIRKSMGVAGRQRALVDYSVPRMVQRTEAVLREVVQRGATWTTTLDGKIPLELPLWPMASTAPAEKIVERGKFRPDRSLRNVATATLTVYLPPAEHASGSAAVICPGGGYAAVAIDKEGHDVARWLTTIGLAGIVLKYRLPRPDLTAGETPWPLQDIMRALRLVREHAADWRIDPRRLGVMGFSAGGHMAAFAARSDRELAFAVLAYPVISMEKKLTHKSSRLNLLGPQPTPEMVERYSLERHLNAATCSTLLVHARDDRIVHVANSIKYAEALQRANIAHKFLLYEHGGHGFGLGIFGGEVATWPDQFAEWIHAHVPAAVADRPRFARETKDR